MKWNSDEWNEGIKINFTSLVWILLGEGNKFLESGKTASEIII